jgi:uncharacterized protein YfaS (alpha-2-macroglobulin family)
MRALLVFFALLSAPAAFAGTFTAADKLAEEQKFQAALDATKAAYAGARDDATRTEGLLRATRLEIALSGFETAVKFLKAAPWPEDPASHALLELYYGYSLRIYQQSYSWEIGKREKTVSKDAVDLKAWTTAQIGQEIGRSFDEAMKEGPWLDQEMPEFYRAFVTLNSYPTGVRSNLRDVITYLATEFMLNQQFWTAGESNELFKLGAARLATNPPAERVDAASVAVHPMERVASWLADLERRHAARGEQEGALEARYELYRSLHDSFTETADRDAIRSALKATQTNGAKVRWWARGQALLAGFFQATDNADRLVEARREAVAGRDAFLGTVPGAMCAAVVSEIDRPDYSLVAMGSDAAAKRSLLLNYRNVRKIYFRIYPDDFEARLRTPKANDVFNFDPNKAQKLLSTPAAAAWSVDLAESRDFLDHRQFVTPPALLPGYYQVIASLHEDFGTNLNQVHVASTFVSGLVLATHSLGNGSVETRALEGESGKAVAGVKVTLYRYDWRSGLAEVGTTATGADGYATFTTPEKQENEYGNYLFVARRGKDLAVERNNVYFGSLQKESRVNSALVYTDRSVYRPEQKVLFKVVAYSGSRDQGHYETAKAGSSVTVRLIDPNYQVVQSRTLQLNAFGSVSGEFTVPTGRPLGNWSIQTLGHAGSASLKVEEYKRPTFEASFREAKEPLRLNHEARMRGEAKYYFGLPVTGGKAAWRVVRTEVTPWWWDFWGGWRGMRHAGQTVASGVAPLGKDGTFEVIFRPAADERRNGEKGFSYNFEVSADVTDEGGETRSASRVFRLGFTAVEARLSWEAGFFRAGHAGSLLAVLSNLDGKPLAGEGSYRIARLAAPPAVVPSELPRDDAPESSFTLPGDRQRARWETNFHWEAITHKWKEADIIGQGKVTHDAKGEGRIPFTPPEKAGVYRLTYLTKDSFGSPFEASRDILVSGAGVPALPLVLIPEMPARKVGETARFFVASGLGALPITVEIFRGGKRESKKMFAGGVLEVPVTAADRGGFTVAASAVKDHQGLRAEANENVPWSDRELKVEFSTFRDKLRPGQKETFRISVKGNDGKALGAGGAEVLAYMYDRSLDLFAPHSFPKVASLYPSRLGAATHTWSLGQAPSWTLFSNLPPNLPSPVLSPDQISYYPSYGIGGPGGRGGRFRMYKAESGAVADMAFSDDAQGGGGMAARAAPMAASAPLEMAKASSNSSAQSAPAPAQSAPAPLRSNFSENAFFAPHLLLSANGSTAVEFTAPESVTSWRVLAHALTKDLRGGTADREARTVKELMVRPYAPRFLREGDSADIKVQVNNAGETALSGELTFDVENAATGKSALADFGVKEAKHPFKVEKGGSVTLTFPLHAPKGVGDYSFRVSAKAGAYTDGELRPFPVLPSRMHLVQSRFAALSGKSEKTLEFADLAKSDDPSRVNERLAVTIDAQLFYGVLEALPYLVDYPYECVEQTLNRFVSTGILSSLFGKYPAVAKMAKDFSARSTRLERFDGPDANRSMQLEETPFLQEAKGGASEGDKLINVLNPETALAQRESALGKITKLQRPDGSFPWFQGGPADEHMTLYVLLSFARAVEFKVAVPKPVVSQAWRYVRGWLEQHLDEMIAHDTGWETTTMVSFALSSYPDASYLGGAFDEALRAKLLAFSFRHWKDHSPLVKGYLALTLKRVKREKDARLVWESVMDSAKHDEQLGTYWAREDRSWLWYNDEIETHAFALRTQMELKPKDPVNPGLVQWLFLNKKLNHWKSTRATAEVIYSLAHYLDEGGELGIPEDIKVEAGGQTTEFHFDPAKYTGKKNQIVVPGEKVSAASSKVVVSKRSPGLAFASATWAFSTEKMPEEERGDFFSVSRRYFKRVASGASFDLQPLAEGAKLALGDELEVHLSLRTKHEAEYVHLRDPRGAGFEPETLDSGWKWDLGISWYEETRDSGSNFFFSQLPVGEYAFKYRLRASTAGTFRVGPATVQSMYAPEFNAYSAGSVVKIE